MDSSCTHLNVVICTIGLLILFGSSFAESSRVAPHRNVIVRKKLFSDIRPENNGAEKVLSRRLPVAAATENENDSKFLPMVSPLYPAGAGPVAGLSAAHLGKDGSAPLLEQTSTSFDSDSADSRDWARQRPHGPASAAAGPAAARLRDGRSGHRPTEVLPRSTRPGHRSFLTTRRPPARPQSRRRPPAAGTKRPRSRRDGHSM